MSKPDFSKLIYILFTIAFLLFILLGPIIFYYSTPFEKDIIVKEKYTRQLSSGRYGASRTIYFIVSSDDTTYQIVDMWWKLDFNTIDDYAKLNIGKKYRVKGYGKHIPFLGMVQNIYDIGQ